MPCVLSFVVVSAGTFQWYQERHSEQIMESFASMAPQKIVVIRSGQHKQIEACELVPGDVVLLTAGAKLPADVRIIEASSDMQVDNASLTGESEPQDRSANCTSKNPMETANIGFLGTLLLKGKGKAVVYNTGDDTLLGKIAALAGKSKQEKTTFTKEVEHFVSMIAWVAVLIGVFCMVYDIANENNIKQSLYSAVCIIIANIPEGLIPAVTLALTLSAKRMSKRQVLVRNLESIETLGCVSVICSDKTGTITCGTMTVSHVFKLGDKNANQLQSYKARQLKSEYRHKSDAVTEKLMNAAVLCNNTTMSKTEDGDGSTDYEVNGFPTETGLFRAAVPVLGGYESVQQVREQYPIVYEIPFNSDNKWHLTIHKYPDGRPGYLLQIKGAPERIINICKNALTSENTIVNLDEETKNNVLLKNVEKAATFGERVLCFAYAHIEQIQTHDNSEFVFKGDHFESANWTINGAKGGFGELTFLGFMSLIDPPRKGVENAIQQCYEAGIKVVMVTGDYEVTAAAIARQVGIIRDTTNDSFYNSSNMSKEKASEKQQFIVHMPDSVTDHDVSQNKSKVVTGSQIDRILEANANGDVDVFNHFWDHVLSYDCLVFARTTPMHKMIIVEQFQKRGMIVAVTGDGVNDAPALNQANVGISMGKNGTDVAREASDIILMDDNFASIVNAVEEGRLITDNIKKCIAYTLCSKLPQLAPILARNWFGLPLAMTMMQVLLIDLGTDIWTGVFMAYEKKEDDIMKRKPRDINKQPMVTWKLMLYSYLHIGVLQTLGCFLAYQQIMYNEGNGVNFTDFLRMDRTEWSKWGAGSGHTTQISTGEDSIVGVSSDIDIGVTSGAGSSDFGQTLFCYSTPNICEFSDTVDFEKLYHHHLTTVQQKILLRRAQTGFYVSLIIMQICAALCCQTRLASLFTQGFENKHLNVTLVLEIMFGIAVVYVTFLQDLFETESLEPACWFAVAPFAILMLIVEEVRKHFGRTYPNGWIRQTLVW